MEQVFRDLINASLYPLTMDEAMRGIGFGNNPYAEILDHIIDAVFHLTGEKKEDIGKSMAYWVLHSTVMSKEEKLMILLEVYSKNRPAQN